MSSPRLAKSTIFWRSQTKNMIGFTVDLFEKSARIWESQITFIFSQKILQHSRLYWWDGSVQIFLLTQTVFLHYHPIKIIWNVAKISGQRFFSVWELDLNRPLCNVYASTAIRFLMNLPAEGHSSKDFCFTLFFSCKLVFLLIPNKWYK